MEARGGVSILRLDGHAGLGNQLGLQPIRQRGSLTALSVVVATRA
jgi:hypothetical protein